MTSTRVCNAAATLALLVACQNGDDTEMRTRCSQDGLQLGGTETCTSWVNTLEGKGHSQFFTSTVLPSSTVTVHVTGQIWLARGELAVSFTDRDGKVQTVQVKAGEPSRITANVRAQKVDDKPGFYLQYAPARATSRADGLVLELRYRQANFNLPGG